MPLSLDHYFYILGSTFKFGTLKGKSKLEFGLGVEKLV